MAESITFSGKVGYHNQGLNSPHKRHILTGSVDRGGDRFQSWTSGSQRSARYRALLSYYGDFIRFFEYPELGSTQVAPRIGALLLQISSDVMEATTPGESTETPRTEALE